MYLRPAVLMLALAALPTTALAADYSKVRCESPGFMHYMGAHLPMLHATANGSSFSARFTDQSITRASTVSAAPDKIVCELTVALSAHAGTRPVNGRFTTTQLPTGKTHWQWQPGY